jgi:hypothetical protein
LDRLLRRDEQGLVARLLESLRSERGSNADPEALLALRRIDQLTDREIDGMLELQRYVDREPGPFGYFEWDDVLDLEPAHRRGLLEALADLHNPTNPDDLFVLEGMDDVIASAIHRGSLIQGGWGHLEVARSLAREFPAARMRFEQTTFVAGRRDIDIVLEMGSRRVDVECKAYDVGTALGEHVRGQIRKDLLRHATDPLGPWTDLLWRFPNAGYDVTSVERIFREELRELISKKSLKMPEKMTESALNARFGAAEPWRLIDVLH